MCSQSRETLFTRKWEGKGETTLNFSGKIKPLPQPCQSLLSHHSILSPINYHLNYLYILVCYLYMVIFFSQEFKISWTQNNIWHRVFYLSKNTFKFIKHSAFSSYNEQNTPYPARLPWWFNEIMSTQCAECKMPRNVILITTKHHPTQTVSSWLEIFLKSSTLGPFTW